MSRGRGTAQHLAGVSAIEIGEGLAGAYCGRWLRLHGAAVGKVEDARSGGDRLRREDLFPDGWRHSTGMTMFAALHAGKESVALDLGAREGVAELRRRIAAADVVVTSLQPDELGALGLRDLVLGDGAGDAVVVSCTPFGLDGPYACYRATDEVSFALGGAMFTFGESGGPPEHCRVPMADYVGGVYGFMSALLGLWAPEAGTVFDVSSQDCLAANLERVTLFYSHLGLIHLRGQGARRYFSGHPGGLYPCQDGYVMVALGHTPISMFALLVERPDLEDHPLFANRRLRQRNPEEFDALVLPWFLAHTAAEIVTRANELTMPFGYVLSPRELLDDAQLAHRGTLVEVEWPDGDGAAPSHAPGLPYRYRDLEQMVAGRQAAPLTVPALATSERSP